MYFIRSFFLYCFFIVVFVSCGLLFIDLCDVLSSFVRAFFSFFRSLVPWLFLYGVMCLFRYFVPSLFLSFLSCYFYVFMLLFLLLFIYVCIIVFRSFLR